MLLVCDGKPLSSAAVWQVCLILIHICMAITLSDAGSSLCVCVNYTVNYISLPVSLGFLFPSPSCEDRVQQEHLESA